MPTHRSMSPVARRRTPLLAAIAAAAPLALVASAQGQCSVSFSAPINATVGAGPRGLVAGDFNNDGRLDLAVANGQANTVTILLGNGSGGFTSNGVFGTDAFPNSIAIGDYNLDGRPDLAIANSNSNNVTVRFGLAGGFFGFSASYPVGTDPRQVIAVDLTGEGITDLVCVNQGSNNVSVLIGNANGTFNAAVSTAGVGAGPLSVASGRFNTDQLADIAVAAFLDQNAVVRAGTGSSTLGTGLGSVPLPSFPYYVVAHDFNGDGFADVAMASGGTVSVKLNAAGAGFSGQPANYPVGTTVRALAVGDFNGDGRADLVATSRDSNVVSILLGTGTGTFTGPVTFTGGGSPDSVTVADFNGDGRPDLAISNATNGTVSVLLNTTAGYPLPVFTQQPSGDIVQAGASISMSASALFFGAQPQYRWRRNGVLLSNGGNLSGVTTGMLTINPVSVADMAVYSVEAYADTCAGVQSSTTSNQVVLGVSVPVVPVTIPNDGCAGATYIGDGTYAFSTVGATTDGPNEANIGFGFGDLQVNQDVWFKYTATCSGVVTVNLCGSDYDSKVAVYGGSSCPTAPNTAIAGNDDSGVCNSLASLTTFSAAAGHQYLIRVGGFGGAVGAAVMTVSCDGSGCLAADVGVQGGVPGRDGLLDNNDFIIFIDNFFNHTGCP